MDNGIHIGSVELDLQHISPPQELVLDVAVAGTDISNSWDFWVYPSNLGPVPGKVHITRQMDERTTAILEAGGTVLLLTHGMVREDRGAQVAIGFSSIFWNTAWTGGQAPHTLGILCDPQHPMFGEFPTDFHSNWQWWDPVSHSQVMILDGFPADLKPLIQPIDTWFENRRLALAFEAAAGGGKLFVCSIDLREKLNERPVSRQLLHAILQYMNSPSFDPPVQLEPEQIRAILMN